MRITCTVAVFIKRFVVQFIKDVHVIFLLHIASDIAKERLRTGSILVGTMGMVVHDNVDTCRSSVVNHRLRTGLVQGMDRCTHHVSTPIVGNRLYSTFGKELFEAPVVPEEAHAAQNIRLAILVDHIKPLEGQLPMFRNRRGNRPNRHRKHTHQKLFQHHCITL